MIAFGCIQHEVVHAAKFNNAADDYAGALNAFADCITASEATAPHGPRSIQVEVAQGLNAQGSCNGGGNNGGGGHRSHHRAVHVTCATRTTSAHTDYGRELHRRQRRCAVQHRPAASGSATDIWGHVEVNDIPLTAGDHIFEGLGFEGRRDGAQEMDVQLPIGNDRIRVTTGANDALVGRGAPGGCQWHAARSLRRPTS